MDDFKVLLYILLGTIYVIGRVMKSRKKRQPQPQTPDETYKAPREEVSFEDLLRDFTEGNEEKQDKQKAPADQYEEPIRHQEPAVRQMSWTGSDEEATSVYERSIEEAESIDVKDQKDDHHPERFDAFEEEEEDTFSAELSNDLHKEDGLRKAIIYKEILDRRHF